MVEMLTSRDALRQELGVESPKSIDHLNLLIYGKPGAGKTYLVGTAQREEATKPLLILDIDGGSVTVNFDSTIDVVQVRSMEEIVVWHKTLREQNNVLNYKTVAIDSLSELQNLDMREIMRAAKLKNPDKIDEEVPSPREYLISQDHIRRTVRAFKDLPLHVIFTAHVQDGEEELGSKSYLPSFLGGKTRTSLPGFLDIVGFMRSIESDGEIKRYLQTQASGRVMAKDRTGALDPLIENPNIPEMWKQIQTVQGDRK